MMLWFAVIIVAQCLVLGLIGWFVCVKNQTAVLDALNVRTSEQGNKSRETAQVCKLLANAGKALSDHHQTLEGFERSLETAKEGDPIVASLVDIRQANQRVEKAVESTIEGLIAACGDLLGEEQSSLESYRANTSAIDNALDGIKQEEILVQIAGTLLGMVRELRAENKAVQKDVAASKDKIIHLLTRASSAEQIARVDTLTQLPNRRAFDEAHARCEEIQDQCGQPFSLILLDIDHFKSVNDEYGHAAGDAVLSLFARILRENCKTSDHACRLGGEEFAVLLPRCEEKAALAIAECYRQKIEAAVLHYGTHQISITVSCGVAQSIPGKSQAHLMERADVALYVAKTEGRNKTCVDSAVDEEQLDMAGVS